jgi:hypothetical protein
MGDGEQGAEQGTRDVTSRTLWFICIVSSSLANARAVDAIEFFALRNPCAFTTVRQKVPQ